jgi:ADP-ribose pyrophosphatase YjhB (NUDIX family)
MTYRCAYQVMRVYWAVRRPRTHGALVAIWYDGRVLLVQNSYVPYRSLPGGYVKAGETGRDAASRELFEETGLRVEPSALRLALDEQHAWEGKQEHIEIFELEVTARPTIKVDNREVLAAEFFTPEEALRLRLFAPLRTVIQKRSASESRGS